MADKVIESGDTLFGSTVIFTDFDGGLNDHGDIAFEYFLDNGVIGIAVARVVPETATAVLLLFGGLITMQRQMRPATGNRPLLIQEKGRGTKPN